MADNLPTNATGPARWYTIALWVTAALYALAILGQLFAAHVMPVPEGEARPFEDFPWFLYVAEAALIPLAAGTAYARHHRFKRVWGISVFCAFVFLPLCPFTLVSLTWMGREMQRELEWTRRRG